MEIIGFLKIPLSVLIVSWLVSYIFLIFSKDPRALVNLKMKLITAGLMIVFISILIFEAYRINDDWTKNVAYLSLPVIIIGFGILFRLKWARIMAIWFSLLILGILFIGTIFSFLKDGSGWNFLAVTFAMLFAGLPVGFTLFVLTRQEIKQLFR